MTIKKILAVCSALAVMFAGGVFYTACTKPADNVSAAYSSDIESTSFNEINSEIKDEDFGTEFRSLIVVSRLTIKGTNFKQYTCYEPDTFVMYAIVSDDTGLAVTRLDNPDGTPVTYVP